MHICVYNKNIHAFSHSRWHSSHVVYRAAIWRRVRTISLWPNCNLCMSKSSNLLSQNEGPGPTQPKGYLLSPHMMHQVIDRKHPGFCFNTKINPSSFNLWEHESQPYPSLCIPIVFRFRFSSYRLQWSWNSSHSNLGGPWMRGRGCQHPT